MPISVPAFARSVALAGTTPTLHTHNGTLLTQCCLRYPHLPAKEKTHRADAPFPQPLYFTRMLHNRKVHDSVPIACDYNPVSAFFLKYTSIVR